MDKKGKIIGIRSITRYSGVSTVALNIAYEFSRNCKQVLLVDFNPNSGLTSINFGHDSNCFSRDNSQNISSIFNPQGHNIIPIKNKVKVFDTNSELKDKFIDLIPSNQDLADAIESSILIKYKKEYFKNFLQSQTKKYDIVIVDTTSDISFINEPLFEISDSIIFPFSNDSLIDERLIYGIKKIEDIDSKNLQKTFLLPNTIYDGRQGLERAKFTDFCNSLEYLIPTYYPNFIKKFKVELTRIIPYKEFVQEAEENQMTIYEYLIENNNFEKEKEFISIFEDIVKKILKLSN